MGSMLKKRVWFVMLTVLAGTVCLSVAQPVFSTSPPLPSPEATTFPRAKMDESERKFKHSVVTKTVEQITWPMNSWIKKPGVEEDTLIFGILSKTDSSAGALLEDIGKFKYHDKKIQAVLLTDIDYRLKEMHAIYVGKDFQKKMPQIMKEIGKNPVLLLGEDAKFLDQGGMIRFVKRGNKYRSESDGKRMISHGLRAEPWYLKLTKAN